MYLDLGDVQVIGQVYVNDVNCGVLWKPPFETDVTAALKSGTNSLRIKVTNLWPNRLIGDEHLPEDCSWNTSVQSDNGYPIAAWPDWLSQDKPSPGGGRLLPLGSTGIRIRLCSNPASSARSHSESSSNADYVRMLSAVNLYQCTELNRGFESTIGLARGVGRFVLRNLVAEHRASDEPFLPRAG